jgi:hypothetical protein
MFFRKKSVTPLTPVPPGELRLAVKAVVQRMARHLASELSRREKRLSDNQKKAAVSAFCLIAGMLFCMTLYRGLYVHARPDRPFLVTPTMSVPVLPRIPDSMLHRRSASPVFPAISHPSTDSITKTQ